MCCFVLAMPNLYSQREPLPVIAASPPLALQAKHGMVNFGLLEKTDSDTAKSLTQQQIETKTISVCA